MKCRYVPGCCCAPRNKMECLRLRRCPSSCRRRSHLRSEKDDGENENKPAIRQLTNLPARPRWLRFRLTSRLSASPRLAASTTQTNGRSLSLSNHSRLPAKGHRGFGFAAVLGYICSASSTSARAPVQGRSGTCHRHWLKHSDSRGDRS